MELKPFNEEDFKDIVLKSIKEAELNSELEGCEGMTVAMSFYSYGPVPHRDKIHFLDVYLGEKGKDEIYIHYPSGESVDIINLDLRDPKIYKVDFVERIVRIGDIDISIPYSNLGCEATLD